MRPELPLALGCLLLAVGALGASLTTREVSGDTCPSSMTALGPVGGAQRPLWYCQHVTERHQKLHGTRCVLLGEPLPIPGAPK